MKKYGIFITILLMTVGFATISTTLSHNGSTDINNSLGDYDVYFSDIKVANKTDLGLMTDPKTFTFMPNVSNSQTTINYTVTNSSKNYDAKVTVKCTKDSNTIAANSFSSSSPLPATSSRSGKVTVVAGSYLDNPVVCRITAQPIETEIKGNASVANPLPTENIGKLVMIGAEKFNIIDMKNDNYVLLAQHSLSSSYRQTINLADYETTFSNVDGWAWTPGPKEVDLGTWAPTVSNYINNYVTYLKGVLGTTNVTGDLITMKQLKSLGCVIQDDYNWSGSETCNNTPYSWLINNQKWWTKSAGSEDSRIWVVFPKNETGRLSDEYYFSQYGIRPTITVSKAALNNYLSNSTEITPTTMCNSFGFTYGKEYEGTDVTGSDTPLICSNDATYANSCLYTTDGTILFCK